MTTNEAEVMRKIVEQFDVLTAQLNQARKYLEGINDDNFRMNMVAGTSSIIASITNRSYPESFDAIRVRLRAETLKKISALEAELAELKLPGSAVEPIRVTNCPLQITPVVIDALIQAAILHNDAAKQIRSWSAQLGLNSDSYPTFQEEGNAILVAIKNLTNEPIPTPCPPSEIIRILGLMELASRYDATAERKGGSEIKKARTTLLALKDQYSVDKPPPPGENYFIHITKEIIRKILEKGQASVAPLDPINPAIPSPGPDMLVNLLNTKFYLTNPAGPNPVLKVDTVNQRFGYPEVWLIKAE